MRKLAVFLSVMSFLVLPHVANAVLLGNGQLDIIWSTPTSGGSPNYYTDYDGTVISSSFGYTTNLEEIFCVSKDDAHAIEIVDFYSITSDLDATFSGLYAKLAQAAWIADNWTTYIGASDDLDTIKGEAQKAVWKVMDVMDRLDGGGKDWEIYNDASKRVDYITNNWYYAHSPGGGTTANYQDYLTPTAPVPEPATMLLLGTGLIGLAGAGRKKFKKVK